VDEAESRGFAGRENGMFAYDRRDEMVPSGYLGGIYSRRVGWNGRLEPGKALSDAGERRE